MIEPLPPLTSLCIISLGPYHTPSSPHGLPTCFTLPRRHDFAELKDLIRAEPRLFLQLLALLGDLVVAVPSSSGALGSASAWPWLDSRGQVPTTGCWGTSPHKLVMTRPIDTMRKHHPISV